LYGNAVKVLWDI